MKTKPTRALFALRKVRREREKEGKGKKKNSEWSETFEHTNTAPHIHTIHSNSSNSNNNSIKNSMAARRNANGTWDWMGWNFMTKEDLEFWQSEFFMFTETNEEREAQVEKEYDKMMCGDEYEILAGGGPEDCVWNPSVHRDMPFPQAGTVELKPEAGRNHWVFLRPGDIVTSMEASSNMQSTDRSEGLLIRKAARAPSGAHYLWVVDVKKPHAEPFVIGAASVVVVHKENNLSCLEMDTGLRDQEGRMCTYMVVPGQLVRDVVDRSVWVVSCVMKHGLLVKRVGSSSASQQKQQQPPSQQQQQQQPAVKGYERVNDLLFIPEGMIAARYMFVTKELIQLTNAEKNQSNSSASAMSCTTRTRERK